MINYKWVVKIEGMDYKCECSSLEEAIKYAVAYGGGTVIQNHRDSARLPWQYDWTAEVYNKKPKPVVKGW